MNDANCLVISNVYTYSLNNQMWRKETWSPDTFWRTGFQSLIKMKKFIVFVYVDQQNDKLARN